MDLQPVAILIGALESRAKDGRTAPRSTAALGRLKLVGKKMRMGMTLDEAIDAVLWNAVLSIETPHLLTGKGGGRNTQATIRCYLAVYARLDVASALASESAISTARVFPETSADPAGRKRNATNRARLVAFDRDCIWWKSTDPTGPSVKAAMASALNRSVKGSVDKFAKLAPELIAGELIRGEAMLLQPSAEGAAARLQQAEDSLEACGLLSSYCATVELQNQIDNLRKRLEAPLDGYMAPIKEFGFVIAQLDHTFHSLHGVMGYEDTDVSENESYVERQLSALTHRGIDIQRVFLYEEDNKAQAMKLAREHADRAAQAISAGGGKGSYKAYLAAKTVAKKVFTKEGEVDEKFLSMVIVDRGHGTQRVVTQKFGPPHEYAASAYPPNVEQAGRYFDVLRSNAKLVREVGGHPKHGRSRARVANGEMSARIRR